MRLTTQDGAALTLRLAADAPIELLKPITASQLKPGDWVNGGAIPHRQSVLALTGLVVISEPVLTP
jgi:hypothetical protein